MAQAVKCLPYKYEDLSFGPLLSHKKPGPETNTYNSSSGKADIGTSLGFAGQPA